MNSKTYYQLNNSEVDDSAKLETAIHYAVDCHKGQTRKGTKIPYIMHPLEVMQILQGMDADTDLLIAGLLHDAVEDTSATIEEIKDIFGDGVAELVGGHTEDKTKSWKERKAAGIKETLEAPLRLKMLIMADKLANMRSIYKDYLVLGDVLWERFNAGVKQQAWYYGEITGALKDMQNDAKTAHYYLELVRLYKEVFDM